MLAKLMTKLFGPRLGKVITVENSNPRFGSISEYELVRVKRKGKTVHWMLTTKDIDDAIYRASTNAEDIPQGVVCKWLKKYWPTR